MQGSLFASVVAARRSAGAAAFAVAALALTGDLAAAPARPAPIIDMHLHAYAADENGPPPLGLCIPRIRLDQTPAATR